MKVLLTLLLFLPFCYSYAGLIRTHRHLKKKENPVAPSVRTMTTTSTIDEPEENSHTNKRKVRDVGRLEDLKSLGTDEGDLYEFEEIPKRAAAKPSNKRYFDLEEKYGEEMSKQNSNDGDYDYDYDETVNKNKEVRKPQEKTHESSKDDPNYNVVIGFGLEDKGLKEMLKDTIAALMKYVDNQDGNNDGGALPDKKDDGLPDDKNDGSPDTNDFGTFRTPDFDRTTQEPNEEKKTTTLIGGDKEWIRHPCGTNHQILITDLAKFRGCPEATAFFAKVCTPFYLCLADDIIKRKDCEEMICEQYVAMSVKMSTECFKHFYDCE
ncbi:hypothetical protein RB195_020570 [Necator americanus]|uniref:Chondroitin proteoglycan 4 domain-containing protein n=1 Tax=Necator americanus TaxID=51031 RepID=A0ABR1CLQ6_NECAM